MPPFAESSPDFAAYARCALRELSRLRRLASRRPLFDARTNSSCQSSPLSTRLETDHRASHPKSVANSTATFSEHARPRTARTHRAPCTVQKRDYVELIATPFTTRATRTLRGTSPSASGDPATRNTRVGRRHQGGARQRIVLPLARFSASVITSSRENARSRTCFSRACNEPSAADPANGFTPTTRACTDYARPPPSPPPPADPLATRRLEIVPRKAAQWRPVSLFLSPSHLHFLRLNRGTTVKGKRGGKAFFSFARTEKRGNAVERSGSRRPLPPLRVSISVSVLDRSCNDRRGQSRRDFPRRSFDGSRRFR